MTFEGVYNVMRVCTMHSYDNAADDELRIATCSVAARAFELRHVRDVGHSGRAEGPKCGDEKLRRNSVALVSLYNPAVRAIVEHGPKWHLS